MKTTTFIAVVLSAAVASRGADKITYEDHILPMLQNACLKCHNPDKNKAGLDLTNYGATVAGGSGGEVVVAGDPSDSTLYLVLTHEEEPHMPDKGNKLTADQIALIKKWIEGGLLETLSSKAKTKRKSAFNMALSGAPTGKPEGPPPMPQHVIKEPPVVTDRAGAVAAIAASPWAPLVAITGQRQVMLYHTDTLEMLAVLPFPVGFPQALSFSRNAQLLLAGGGRGGAIGRVVVWNVANGRPVIELGKELDSVLGVDISADQTQITLGGPGRLVKVHDTADGEVIRSIKKHTDWVTAIAYSNDGVLVATGDRNGGLWVWESHTGGEFYTLSGHSGAITDLAWRSDSNVLASSSEDGTVRLWEMQAGKQVKNWKPHGGQGALSVSFAPDGNLATAGRDKHVRTWDPNGKQIRDLGAFKEIAQQVAFTHDGKRVIGGDWSGEIRVWNAADGKQVGTLAGNPPSLAMRIKNAQDNVAKVTALWQAADNAHKATVEATKAPTAQLEEAKTMSTASKKAVQDAKAAAKKAMFESVKATAAHGESAKQRDAKKAGLVKLIAARDDALANRDDAKKNLAIKTAETVSQKTSADKRAAEAATAQAAADNAKEDQALADAATKAKQAADDAAKALAAAQQAQTAADENYKKLIQTATTAETAVATGKTALTAAEKGVTDRDNELKAANQKVDLTRSTQDANNKAATDKTKLVNDRAKVLKDALAKVPPAKAAADKALASLNAAKNVVTRWQAEQINVPRYAAWDELDSDIAEHEGRIEITVPLKAAFDKELAALNATNKRLADMPGIVKKNEQALASSTQAQAVAQESLDTAIATANDKEAYAKMIGESAAKSIAERAAANKDNPKIVLASTKISEALALLTEDAVAARSVIKGMEGGLAQAKTNTTNAQTALKSAKDEMAALPARVAERQKAHDAAKAQHAAAAAEQKKAADLRAAAQAKFDKFTADYLAKLPK